MTRVQFLDAEVMYLSMGEGHTLHKHDYAHPLEVWEGGVVVFDETGDRMTVAPGDRRVIFPAGKIHGFRATKDGTVVVTLHPRRVTEPSAS